MQRVKELIKSQITQQAHNPWNNFISTSMQHHDHARIQKVLSDGSKFDNFIFFLVGSPNTAKKAIIGPSAKRHLNGVSLVGDDGPNVECWLGSFVIFQGIRTSIANLYFCDFSEGVRTPCPPPLDLHMMASYRHWYDIILMLCACWELLLLHCVSSLLHFLCLCPFSSFSFFSSFLYYLSVLLSVLHSVHSQNHAPLVTDSHLLYLTR